MFGRISRKATKVDDMAKDGYWSWIVLMGAFTSMFLETGMVKSLGVLLPELREQFTTFTWVIGLSISLAPGFGAITCIGATVLRKVSSNRFIIICFGTISCLGLLVTALASSVYLFSLGLVLTGFSLGAEATTFAMLPDYFDKYYDISNSIAHSGFAFGIMIMPVVTQYLLYIYGCRGTILILCAMNTHIIMAGFLLRPVAKQRQSSKVQSILYSKQLSSTPSHFLGKVLHMLSLDVFKNFKLVALLSCCFATGVYYNGWLIYFVPHAENLSFSSFTSSTLATIGGLGNLFGCFAFPLLSRGFSSRNLIIFGQSGAFLSLIMDPVFSIWYIYYGLMACSFTLNFVYSVYACALSREALNFVTDDEELFHGFINWNFVLYGAGSLLSGFFAGWLFDKYQNYTSSFVFLGIFALVGPFFMLFDGFYDDWKVHISSK